MKVDLDADGHPFTEVAIPGGVARATLLPAGHGQDHPFLLRLEVRAPARASVSAVELPAAAAGELLAAALHLRRREESHCPKRSVQSKWHTLVWNE